MEVQQLIEEINVAGENLSKETVNKSQLSTAYCRKASKALDKITNKSDYNEVITGLWFVAAHLNQHIVHVKPVRAFTDLCLKLFRQCAKAILNIQWEKIEEDSSLRHNFLASLANLHTKLLPLSISRFHLLEPLSESPWTHPTLAKVMGGELDDTNREEIQCYIRNEDPIILQLRVDMMLKENCEEYALNLCNSYLGHPELQSDLGIRKTQFFLLYKLGQEDKLQEECQKLSIKDAVHVIKQLQTSKAHRKMCTVVAQTFMVQNWIRPSDVEASKELLSLWIVHQLLVDKEQDQFKESVWAMAKLSQSTDQIIVFIDVLRDACGETYLQLYVDMCIFAINVDKGQMEMSIKEGNREAAAARRSDMASVCAKLSCLCHQASIKVARMCVLTAFALKPAEQSFAKIGAFYDQGSECCDKCGKEPRPEQGTINPATLYEVERLLNMLRPDYLSPSPLYADIQIMCRRYLHEGLKNVDELNKTPDTSESVTVACDVAKPQTSSTKPTVSISTALFESLCSEDAQNIQMLLNKMSMQDVPSTLTSLPISPSYPPIYHQTSNKPINTQNGEPSASAIMEQGNTIQQKHTCEQQYQHSQTNNEKELPKQQGSAQTPAINVNLQRQQQNPELTQQQLEHKKQIQEIIAATLKQDSTTLQKLMQAASPELLQVVLNIIKEKVLKPSVPASSQQQMGHGLPTLRLQEKPLSTVTTLVCPSLQLRQQQQTLPQQPNQLQTMQNLPQGQQPNQLQTMQNLLLGQQPSQLQAMQNLSHGQQPNQLQTIQNLSQGQQPNQLQAMHLPHGQQPNQLQAMHLPQGQQFNQLQAMQNLPQGQQPNQLQTMQNLPQGRQPNQLQSMQNLPQRQQLRPELHEKPFVLSTGNKCEPIKTQETSAALASKIFTAPSYSSISDRNLLTTNSALLSNAQPSSTSTAASAEEQQRAQSFLLTKSRVEDIRHFLQSQMPNLQQIKITEPWQMSGSVVTLNVDSKNVAPDGPQFIFTGKQPAAIEFIKSAALVTAPVQEISTQSKPQQLPQQQLTSQADQTFPDQNKIFIAPSANLNLRPMSSEFQPQQSGFQSIQTNSASLSSCSTITNSSLLRPIISQKIQKSTMPQVHGIRTSIHPYASQFSVPHPPHPSSATPTRKQPQKIIAISNLESSHVQSPAVIGTNKCSALYVTTTTLSSINTISQSDLNWKIPITSFRRSDSQAPNRQELKPNKLTVSIKLPESASVCPRGETAQEAADKSVTSKEADKDSAIYRCILCSIAFKTLEHLQEHVKTVCRPDRQTSNVFNTKFKLSKTTAAIAGVETTTVFQCLRCFELCISNAGIKQHRMTCRKVPPLPSCLNRHRLSSDESGAFKITVGIQSAGEEPKGISGNQLVNEKSGFMSGNNLLNSSSVNQSVTNEVNMTSERQSVNNELFGINVSHSVTSDLSDINVSHSVTSDLSGINVSHSVTSDLSDINVSHSVNSDLSDINVSHSITSDLNDINVNRSVISELDYNSSKESLCGEPPNSFLTPLVNGEGKENSQTALELLPHSLFQPLTAIPAVNNTIPEPAVCPPYPTVQSDYTNSCVHLQAVDAAGVPHDVPNTFQPNVKHQIKSTLTENLATSADASHIFTSQTSAAPLNKTTLYNTLLSASYIDSNCNNFGNVNVTTLESVHTLTNIPNSFPLAIGNNNSIDTDINQMEIADGKIGEEFASPKEVRLNIKTNEDVISSKWCPKNVRCEICQITFRTESILLQHFVLKHLKSFTVNKSLPNSLSYLCHFCPTTFPTLQQFMQHILNHSAAIYNNMKALTATQKCPRNKRITLHCFSEREASTESVKVTNSTKVTSKTVAHRRKSKLVHKSFRISSPKKQLLSRCAPSGAPFKSHASTSIHEGNNSDLCENSNGVHIFPVTRSKQFLATKLQPSNSKKRRISPSVVIGSKTRGLQKNGHHPDSLESDSEYSDLQFSQCANGNFMPVSQRTEKMSMSNRASIGGKQVEGKDCGPPPILFIRSLTKGQKEKLQTCDLHPNIVLEKMCPGDLKAAGYHGNGSAATTNKQHLFAKGRTHDITLGPNDGVLSAEVSTCRFPYSKTASFLDSYLSYLNQYPEVANKQVKSRSISVPRSTQIHQTAANGQSQTSSEQSSIATQQININQKDDAVRSDVENETAQKNMQHIPDTNGNNQMNNFKSPSEHCVKLAQDIQPGDVSANWNTASQNEIAIHKTSFSAADPLEQDERASSTTKSFEHLRNDAQVKQGSFSLVSTDVHDTHVQIISTPIVESVTGEVTFEKCQSEHQSIVEQASSEGNEDVQLLHTGPVCVSKCKTITTEQIEKSKVSTDEDKTNAELVSMHSESDRVVPGSQFHHTETLTSDSHHIKNDTSHPPQTETHTSDPSQTETHTSDPSQTETHTSDPPQTGTHTSDPPQTGTLTSDPLQTGTHTSDPPQTETHTSDPPQTETHTSDQSEAFSNVLISEACSSVSIHTETHICSNKVKGNCEIMATCDQSKIIAAGVEDENKVTVPQNKSNIKCDVLFMECSGHKETGATQITDHEMATVNSQMASRILVLRNGGDNSNNKENDDESMSRCAGNVSRVNESKGLGLEGTKYDEMDKNESKHEQFDREGPKQGENDRGDPKHEHIDKEDPKHEQFDTQNSKYEQIDKENPKYEQINGEDPKQEEVKRVCLLYEQTDREAPKQEDVKRVCLLYEQTDREAPKSPQTEALNLSETKDCCSRENEITGRSESTHCHSQVTGTVRSRELWDARPQSVDGDRAQPNALNTNNLNGNQLNNHDIVNGRKQIDIKANEEADKLKCFDFVNNRDSSYGIQSSVPCILRKKLSTLVPFVDLGEKYCQVSAINDSKTAAKQSEFSHKFDTEETIIPENNNSDRCIGNDLSDKEIKLRRKGNSQKWPRNKSRSKNSLRSDVSDTGMEVPAESIKSFPSKRTAENSPQTITKKARPREIPVTPKLINGRSVSSPFLHESNSPVYLTRSSEAISKAIHQKSLRSREIKCSPQLLPSKQN